MLEKGAFDRGPWSGNDSGICSLEGKYGYKGIHFAWAAIQATWSRSDPLTPDPELRTHLFQWCSKCSINAMAPPLVFQAEPVVTNLLYRQWVQAHRQFENTIMRGVGSHVE